MSNQQYEAYLPNYVDNRINAIIGDAPDNLNTLGQISKSIGNDNQINTSLQNEINLKQNIIPDESLTISKVAGLQTQLNDRYTKDEVDDLIDSTIVEIDQVEGLQTILDTKATVPQLNQTQDVITSGSVTIDKK